MRGLPPPTPHAKERRVTKSERYRTQPRAAWKRALIAVPVVGISVLGLAAGAAIGKRLATGASADDYAFFDELVEVKHLLSQRYVDAPDDARLREGAIRGMVEALDDPYTVYVPAAEQRNFNKDLTGEYVGIGAQVNQQEGWLTIVSPLEDSPAFRAGLMAEDRVVEIDGKSTQGLSVDECIDLLLGEPGTSVVLTVERSGERSQITIVRERIKTRAVKGFRRSDADPNAWDYLIDPNRRIAYIRLTQFTPGCADEVEAALRSVGADSGALGGLVLDLRFNPGGLLNEAEKIADLFLAEGVIVSTRGRAHPEQVRRAEAPGTLPDFPIVLLLNGQSASASEVLAGALVENNRAVAVGTRSFGKGSVQSVLHLPSGNGSELKLTEQGYYLPSGRSLSRKDDSPAWGVDPTDGFYVPVTDAELIAMLEVRRKNEVLRAAGGTPPTGNWSDPEWVLEELKDAQLAAAVKAMRGKIDTGAWVKTGQAGQAVTAIGLAEAARLTQLRERMLRELDRTDRRLEALESAVGEVKPQDLWADSAEVSGGVVEIRDKNGALIATLDVTGPDLERWLVDAPVKPRPATPQR
ncbi:MAG: S41 family peptidase [Planctomycetota bacterium]|nr:S41 family peptidase [Planctomycetota bacterium]